ncbi:hypothetical protein V8G54_007715 [Vigna mungo]|uniref:Sugar phosphate transporter domain-containing protein n=1 Tax=Vigna mungo TaxID=3915 RepID=A0AAQ3P5Z0_VIGMU
MSLKPSYSAENLMLPVSDPPNEEDRERLLKSDSKTFRGRRIYAAISYMSCAGSAHSYYSVFGFCCLVVLLILFNKAVLSSYDFPSSSIVTLLQEIMNWTRMSGEENGLLCLPKVEIKWLELDYDQAHDIFDVRTFFILLNIILCLLPLQMVCSCCFLYVLRRWRMISLIAGESVITADNSKKFVPLRTLKHTLPLTGAYLLYMLVTMESVRGVNVPMYTTLRRTTVVFTMLVEYMLMGHRYTSSVTFRMYNLGRVENVVISVGLIAFGAFIAGARDFSFDAYGYAIVFLSNITTAIYLAMIARVGKTSGLNSFGLMWCNGIICGPFLAIWTLIRGDLKMTLNFPYLFSPGFIVVLLFSCILAFFLNYSIFLNTTLNSALTQTICGNLKVCSLVSGVAINVCIVPHWH